MEAENDEIEKDIAYCEKINVINYLAPIPILNLESIGPHLFTTPSMQLTLTMSHLPRLMFQKYGQCTIHYDPDRDPIMTKAIFKENPYVTEFCYQFARIPQLQPKVNSHCTNLVQYWSTLYGFKEDPTILPELYLNDANPYQEYLNRFPKRLRVAVFSKNLRTPWGFKTTQEVASMLNSLVEKFHDQIDFFHVGSINPDFGLLRVCYLHHRPRELFHFLSLCHLYIGSADTGIMHACAALKIPSIIIAENYHQAAHGTWCYPGNLHVMTQNRNFGCQCQAQVVNDTTELDDLITKFIKEHLLNSVKCQKNDKLAVPLVNDLIQPLDII